MADERQKFVSNEAVMPEIRCTDDRQHMNAFAAFWLYGQGVVE